MLICVTRNFDIPNVGESNMSVQGKIFKLDKSENKHFI